MANRTVSAHNNLILCMLVQKCGQCSRAELVPEHLPVHPLHRKGSLQDQIRLLCYLWVSSPLFSKHFKAFIESRQTKPTESLASHFVGWTWHISRLTNRRVLPTSRCRSSRSTRSTWPKVQYQSRDKEQVAMQAICFMKVLKDMKYEPRDHTTEKARKGSTQALKPRAGVISP